MYEPVLELAHTDFIVHAHVQKLVDRSMEAEECRGLFPLGGHLEWWRADPEFARHLKRLRDGRRCQFQGPEQGVGEAGHVGVG